EPAAARVLPARLSQPCWRFHHSLRRRDHLEAPRARADVGREVVSGIGPGRRGSADPEMKAGYAPKIAAVRFQGQGRACERTAEGGRAPGEVPAAADTTAEDVAVGKHVERVLSAERPPRAAGAGLAVGVHEERDEI